MLRLKSTAFVLSICFALGQSAVANVFEEQDTPASTPEPAVPVAAEKVDDEDEPEKLEQLVEELEETKSGSMGIVPALTSIFQIPKKMHIRNPDAPVPPEDDIEYNRFFPIGAEEALRRGFLLPRPVGLAFAAVNTTSRQQFTQLEVAVGVDVVPPPDTPLKPIPFVNVDTEAETDTLQLTLDTWVLPFLNVFASYGKADGTANADVVIDLDSLPTVCRPNPLPGRPPICIGENLGGEVRLQFPVNVEPTNLTFGATAVFSKGFWFGAGTVSRTLSIAKKDTSDIRSWRGSVRFGRRLIFGKQNILSPYIGANYTQLNTRVSGTTRLRDALPGGQDLTVRYKGKVENLDELAPSIGLNIGLRNGMNFNLEYNRADPSSQFLFSVQQRF